MYNKEFIEVAKIQEQGLVIDDPRLADVLIQIENIEIPQFNNIKLNCPICLAEIEAPISMQCGHVYCETCIGQLEKQYPGSVVRCPLCRKPSRSVQKLQLQGGTKQEYIEAQQRRLLIVQKEIQFIDNLASKFGEIQKSYKRAKEHIESNILNTELAMDSLDVEIAGVPEEIEELEAKIELLKQTQKELEE